MSDDITGRYEDVAEELSGKVLGAFHDVSHIDRDKFRQQLKSTYLRWIQVQGDAQDDLRDMFVLIGILADRLIEKEVARITNALLARCDSPIEKQLVFALKDVLPFPYIKDVRVQLEYVRDLNFIVLHGPSPKYFKLDIAIPHLKVAVECDGHEFHSSKESRGRDAKRDRELQAAGWMVLRFTGTEITADARKCAEGIFQAALAKGGQMKERA